MSRRALTSRPASVPSSEPTAAGAANVNASRQQTAPWRASEPAPIAAATATTTSDAVDAAEEADARRLAEAIASQRAAEEAVRRAAEEEARRAAEAAAAELAAAAIEPADEDVVVAQETIELAEPVKPGEPMPVVVPMTRTVRIEVPPRGASSRTTDIERLLRVAAARGASALFFTSESRPYIRVDGDIRQLENEAVLSRSDVEAAIVEIAPGEVGKNAAAEWLREYPELGRIRCTTFSDHRGPGLLLRMIATRAATAEQLGLSREVQALATETQGLVLVAGPRASGKSTLLSALVDLVNRQRAEFVITLERQIRLVHDNKSALVSQREIRGGADEALAAARSALREGPDVLVIDDLISPHMVPLILTAASEGLLVFVSMPAASTTDAVQRFIEMAAPEMRAAVQGAMAESFRGAVAQVLLKKTGGGLLTAREVLLATAPVARVINEGQLGQLPHVLDGGRKYGMVSFTDTLIEYVRAGSVDVREAFRKTSDRERLLAGLKREKIDTSLIERLA
jgi:twitching motility protein PilT